MLEQADLDKLNEIFEKYSKLMQETLDRVDAMEDVLYNKIIAPAETLEKDYNTGLRRDDFKSKYAEKLSGFNDKLKAIEGDDFDIVEKAFSDFDAIEGEKNGDEYVEKLITKIQSQLDKIGKAFNPDAVVIEATATEIPTEGEAVKIEEPSSEEEQKEEEPKEEETKEAEKAVENAVEEAEKEVAEETKEEATDEEKKEAEEAVENAVEEAEKETEEEIDNPEEVEDDLEELEKEYEAMKKRGEI